MIYFFKNLTIKTLKFIHNFFLKFGINISYVGKQNSFSPIEHNSSEIANKYYSSKDYINKISTKIHIKFFHQIIEIIKIKNIDLNNKKIADFGCGIGNLLLIINKEYVNCNLFGFDFSSKALEIAKERLKTGHFQQFDIYTNTEIKYNFDIIFCTEVLEHLLYPNIAINNLLSNLSENGIIFLSVPDGRKDTFAGHINFWSPESWDVFISSQVKPLRHITGNINDKNLYALIFK